MGAELRAFLRFIKWAALLLIAIIIGLIALSRYANTDQDYFAISCQKIGEPDKTPAFMIRKRPFSEKVDGLYQSPIKNPKLSKSAKLKDLYLVGVEVETDSNWITFQWRKNREVYFRLDRTTLDLTIGKFRKLDYDVDPSTPTQIQHELSCRQITTDEFYIEIKDEFETRMKDFRI